MTTMPSGDPDADDDAGIVPGESRTSAHAWNRKVHYYLGLYLLVFLWFFSISGLVLNHSSWEVAQFWRHREEATTQHAIRIPEVTGDVAMAMDLMRQLGIVGEPGEIKRSADTQRFEIQVVKPGHVYRVVARMDSARAAVTEIQINAWGVMDALHKFTGVSREDRERTRDWVLTSIWSLAMDALAAGMVALVGTGLYLWYRLKAKRVAGIIALTLGIACCMFFLFGLGILLA